MQHGQFNLVSNRIRSPTDCFSYPVSGSCTTSSSKTVEKNYILEVAKTKLEKRKLSQEIINLNLEIEVLTKTKNWHGKPTDSASIDVQYQLSTTVYSSFPYQTYTGHTAAEDNGGIT